MGRTVRKTQMRESAKINNMTYNYYYNRICELAISRFKWEGLPDTVDPRFLEMTLFTDGMAVFFQDEVLGHLALQTTLNGMLDVYRIPINRRAYASNGYSKELTNEDSVLIFNNMLHTNTVSVVEYYARKLYECDRTIDVNLRAQKTPVMILCDENQRLTMKQLYMKYDGNEPFIFGNKDLDLKKITSISTNAPYVADKVFAIKQLIWNECMTYLGIANMDVNKKERLLNTEVTNSVGSTMTSRNTWIDERKQACEKINRMFGLNVSVEFSESMEMNIGYTDEGEGGEEE